MKIDNEFSDKVVPLIVYVRGFPGRVTDLAVYISNSKIGRMNIKEEQGGESRAKYGRDLINDLSVNFGGRFGSNTAIIG